MTNPQGRVGYREVAEHLRGEIRSGRLRPGDRLPSESEIQVIYGVAVVTGRRAVRLLQDEGVVIVRHGYPTRVAGDAAISKLLGPLERALVVQPRHTVLSSRPPTADERDEWGGTWMTDAHLFGRHLGTWPADRHEFIIR